MRHVIATTAFALLIAQVLLAQTQPMKPTAPGAGGDPTWQGKARFSDGRVFVTDGGLAIDAAIAKPAKLPEREFAGNVLEKYFSAPHTDEYGLSELHAVSSGLTFTTPKGIPISATYIKYLTRVLPARTTRLRMSGDMQPVVIVADGKAVGVLMPVKK